MLHVYTHVRAFFSQLYFPRLTWDTLIQIPCYVQPALGPPRSCLIPRPVLRKAGNGSKKPPIREGKWSIARSQPDSLHWETWQGCYMHSLCCRRISSRNKESGCKDAQKVMKEEEEPLTDFPVWHFRAAEDTNAGNYSNFFLKLFFLPHFYSRGS